VSVVGNRSRIDTKERALASERLDDLIEWYLSARLQNFSNVYIGGGEKVDPTMYMMNIRGQNYLGVHGDYDGGALKIQALKPMIKTPLYAVLHGHLHHNRIDTVQGIKTVMAGSFFGMDDFLSEGTTLESVLANYNKFAEIRKYLLDNMSLEQLSGNSLFEAVDGGYNSLKGVVSEYQELAYSLNSTLATREIYDKMLDSPIPQTQHELEESAEQGSMTFATAVELPGITPQLSKTRLWPA